MKKITIKLAFIFILINLFGFSLYSQELSAKEIFEKVNDEVVVLIAYDFQGKPFKQGSGVVISDNGLILTNYHVFAECEKISVFHHNEIIDYSTIEAADVDNDILILKIYENKFNKVDIGNSDNINVGEKIYAIGSPLGYENSISEGIVSGLRNMDNKGRNFIQITASISSGSSGGAVLNSKGELVGISTYQNKRGQNVNFAIPINDVFKLLEENKDNPQTKDANDNFFKGYNAYLAKKYKDAIFYYTAYLKIMPNSSEGYYNLGLANKKLKDYNEALSNFTKAIEIDPENSDALISRASVLILNGYYKEAIEDLNKSLFIDNSDAIAYNKRGEAYYYLSSYKSALKDLDEAIALNENYSEAFYNRGRVYTEINDYISAIADLSKAIELFPNYRDAYYSRARTYYNLNNYEKSINDYEKCIELVPEDKFAYNNLGWLYFDKADYSQAIKNLKKCFDIDPKDWDSVLGISLAFYAEDDVETAEKLFKELIKMEPRLKQGLKGIELLEKDGYFYSQIQKKVLAKFFDEFL